MQSMETDMHPDNSTAKTSHPAMSQPADPVLWGLRIAGALTSVFLILWATLPGDDYHWLLFAIIVHSFFMAYVGWLRKSGRIKVEGKTAQ